MKTTFYILCALGALSAAAMTPAEAASTPKTALILNVAASSTSTPKTLSALLGRPKKKRASSAPARLNKQLHQRQVELKAKAWRESQGKWKRCQRG